MNEEPNFPLAPPLKVTAPFSVRCWGRQAIFTRYETPVERDTYSMLTVPAAEGLLKKIFWHPGVDYEIQRIHVMRPVKIYSFYGQELKEHPPGGGLKSTDVSVNRTLRLRRFIHEPDYVIEARLTLDPQLQEPGNRAKYESILLKRLQKGQNYEQPYFGMRECSADYEFLPRGTVIRPWDADADLGQLPLYHEYRPHAQGETHYIEQIRDAATGRWTTVTRRGFLIPHFFEGHVEAGTLDVPAYREESL